MNRQLPFLTQSEALSERRDFRDLADPREAGIRGREDYTTGEYVVGAGWDESVQISAIEIRRPQDRETVVDKAVLVLDTKVSVVGRHRNAESELHEDQRPASRLRRVREVEKTRREGAGAGVFPDDRVCVVG